MDIIDVTRYGIQQGLEQAAIRREFIETHQYARGIGKTTALVEFAKKYGLNVIISHNNEKHVRELYGYDHIYTLSNISRIDGKFVFDEGVDYTQIPVSKTVTGFVMEKQ